MQAAPAPLGDVLAELGGQLPAGIRHGLGQQLVAVAGARVRVGAVGAGLPPLAVGLVEDLADDLEPTVAAVGLGVVGLALAALDDQAVAVQVLLGARAARRADPQALALGPQLLGELVAEGQLEGVAPDGVEVGGRGGVGLLVVVPVLQQLLGLADVLGLALVGALDVDLQQVGHQQLGDLAAVVQLHLLHVVRRDLPAVLDLRLDELVDPLAAGAVAPVLRQEVRVVLVGDGLVGGDDVAALGVVVVRQRGLRDPVGPPVGGVPAGGREAAVGGGGRGLGLRLVLGVDLAVAVGVRLGLAGGAGLALAGAGAVPVLALALGGLAADRDAAGGLVADVALGVGVDQVLRGDLEVGRGLAERREVGRPVEREEAVHGLARVQRGPAQRHRVALGAVRGRVLHGRLLADLDELVVAVGDDRAVVGLADGDLTAALARDLDGLLAGDEGQLLAVVEVGVGGDLLQVEVGDVRAEVGHAPGDVLVVADDDARHAGEGVAGHVEGALRAGLVAVQAHLVPERGHLRREVRVVGQQRLAGGRVLAGDDPRVGADAVAVGAQQRRDLLQVLRQRREAAAQPAGGRAAARRALTGRGPLTGAGGALGVVVLAGVDRAALDDRLVPVVRVGRVQLVDLLGGQPRGGQGAVDLVLHVAAQVPGHGLEPGDGVDRVPGLGLVVVLEREGRVLDGQRLALVVLQVGVDPVGVRLQVFLGGRRQLGVVLLLRDLPPAHGAQEGVGLHLLGAEHLREPSGRHVAADVHLPEAVLRLDEALGAEEVLGAVGVDLGNAVAVAHDLHLARQPLELEGALRLGEGGANGTDAPVRAEGDARHEQQHGDDHEQAGASPLLLLAGAVLVGGHRCP